MQDLTLSKTRSKNADDLSMRQFGSAHDFKHNDFLPINQASFSHFFAYFFLPCGLLSTNARDARTAMKQHEETVKIVMQEQTLFEIAPQKEKAQHALFMGLTSQ